MNEGRWFFAAGFCGLFCADQTVMRFANMIRRDEVKTAGRCKGGIQCCHDESSAASPALAWQER